MEAADRKPRDAQQAVMGPHTVAGAAEQAVRDIEKWKQKAGECGGYSSAARCGKILCN